MEKQEYDLIIRGGTCLLPQETKKTDIALKDGKIASIGDLSEATSKSEIKADGLHVLPGVIDSQVHFREPGLVHKEDIHTGSRSAVLGGVTTFLEMPNTKPPTIDRASIQEKIDSAKETSFANFGFFIGATGENLSNLQEMAGTDGCPGVKIFLGSSTGSLLLYDEDKLLEIFQNVKAPIAVHSENERVLNERMSIRDAATSVHAHYDWRNVDSALSSTEKILEIARKSGRKVHVLHITTKEEIELLEKNKDVCTFEITPQHLTLSAPNCYDKLGTYAQMNPPIREEEHRLGLWTAVKNKSVDVLGSDHAPHTKEEKDKGYPHSPSGMPGVQTIVPIMLDHVNKGELSLEHFVELLCSSPAKLYGLKNKGSLIEGYDGDVTIVDMNAKVVIDDADMASKVEWTPFHGKEVHGFPTHTIVGGKIAMERGKVSEEVRGSAVAISHE